MYGGFHSTAAEPLLFMQKCTGECRLQRAESRLPIAANCPSFTFWWGLPLLLIPRNADWTRPCCGPACSWAKNSSQRYITVCNAPNKCLHSAASITPALAMRQHMQCWAAACRAGWCMRAAGTEVD